MHESRVPGAALVLDTSSPRGIHWLPRAGAAQTHGRQIPSEWGDPTGGNYQRVTLA